MAKSMATQAAATRSHRPKLYVGTACDQCFRTKARCAGERPICVRCKKNDTPCTYSTGRKRSRLSLDEVPQLSRSLTDSSASPPSPATLPSAGSTVEQGPTVPALRLEPMQIDRHESLQEFPLYPRCTESLEGAGSLNCPELTTEDLSLDTISTWSGWLHEPSLTSPQSNSICPVAIMTPPTPAPMDLNYRPDQADAGKVDSAPMVRPRQRHRSRTQPTETRIPGLKTVDNADLRDLRTRLQAYVLDVSQDTAGEILEELQRSLSTVGSYLNSLENMEMSLLALDSNWDSALPASPAAQGSPIVAVIYAHIIELVFFCYLKMRRQHRPAASDSLGTNAPDEKTSLCSPAFESRHSTAPPESSSRSDSGQSAASGLESRVFDSLLDQYIARDMRQCQSFAQRLIQWCSKMAGENGGSQANDTTSAMEMIIDSLKACKGVVV